MSNWPWWMYLIGFAHTAVYAWAFKKRSEPTKGLKYTGPAKPIRLWRRPLIDYAECVVFLSGIVVVGLDVYVWRANMPL